MTGTNGSNGNGSARVGTDKVKQGLAQMLKGGVIVSVTFCLYEGIYAEKQQGPVKLNATAPYATAPRISRGILKVNDLKV